MAITMNGSGQIDTALENRTSFTSVASYSFCSSVITTTASYADTQIQFGAKLKEIHIINTGNKPVAFQFSEFFGTNKDSGLVPANDRVTIRTALKDGIAFKNADGSSSTVVVFGV